MYRNNLSPAQSGNFAFVGVRENEMGERTFQAVVEFSFAPDVEQEFVDFLMLYTATIRETRQSRFMSAIVTIYTDVVEAYGGFEDMFRLEHAQVRYKKGEHEKVDLKLLIGLMPCCNTQ